MKLSGISQNSLISCIDPLGFPFKTPDPFLFCVYHKDNYPKGNGKMQAPRRGNGHDFDPNTEYRMYHGDLVPGFPQHPHRGFETVTATVTGFIDHSDSLNNAGRYGQGDLQWMTAGKGIVHGENFPLIYDDKPNPLKLFQIWLNLPGRNKMVDPDFVMHWKEEIPVYKSDDSLTSVTVWAGEYFNKKALTPTQNSWAKDDKNEVMILHATLQPNGIFTIPTAKYGKEINRMAYFIEGLKVSISSDDENDGQSLSNHMALTLNSDKSAVFKNVHPTTTAEILVLQGRPIGEPVALYGPFVMNTEKEIEQAYSDYRKTQFGGWKWKEDAVIFPKEKGRFALINGKEIYPPSI